MESETERDRLLTIMRENPGCTRRQLSELSGLSEARMPGILGDEVRLLVQENKKDPTFSDEDIKQALIRGVQLAGEPLTATGYDAVKDRFAGPSSVRVIQRYSTWSQACEQAGVVHGRPRRPKYQRRWTDEEMLEWVATYFQSAEFRGSYADFSQWAKQTLGSPSAQSVRNRLGSWQQVKRDALALINEGDRKNSE
jgi:hypothetical protein